MKILSRPTNPSGFQKMGQVLITLLLIFFSVQSFAQLFPVTGNQSVCEGDIEVYTTPDSSGCVFVWNVGGSATWVSSVNTSNSTQDNTVTWGSAGSTAYVTLKVYKYGNLISQDSLPVAIYSVPAPFITSSFNSDCVDPVDKSDIPGSLRDTFPCHTVCEGMAVVYTTSQVSGNAYYWSVTGNYTNITGDSTHEATVTWGSPGQATVEVTEITPQGCSSSYEICIEIVPKPTSLFHVNNQNGPIYSVPMGAGSIPSLNICVSANNQVCFYDNSSGAISWNWYFGNGNTSQQQNPCTTFPIPGTYQVLLVTENECHCKDTSTIYVFVEEMPGPEIDCKNVVCDNGTFTYSAIMPNGPCPNGTYNWQVSGNGTIVTANGTINTQTGTTLSGTGSTHLTVSWNGGPIGTISLMVTGCAGVCTQFTTIEIPIIPPVIDITGDSILCLNEVGYFSVTCFPGTVYEWKIDNVTQPDQDNDLWHSFSTPGNHYITVNYTNDYLNCSGISNTFLVRVLPEFTVSGPEVICENTTDVISGLISSLEWYVKDNTGSIVYGPVNGMNFNIPLLSPGNYTVLAYDVSVPRTYCNEYAVHGLTIIPSPPAPTMLNGPAQVCPGQAYVYSSAPSSSGYYLMWVVNDSINSDTTNGNNLTVTWSSASSKNIMLYQVSKASDCPSMPLVFPVSNKGFPADSIIGPDTVCSNTLSNNPEQFFVTQVYDDYTWSISPSNYGSVVAGQNTNTANVIWNNVTGSATITMIPTQCGVNGTPITQNIVIINAPALGISGPDTVCQGSGGNWLGSLTGSYSWTIKSATNGTQVASGGSNPASFNFPNQSGSYILTMSAMAQNCNAPSVATKSIHVFPEPTANLSFTGNIGCISQNTVNFTVSVQGTPPYTYDWYHNTTLLGVTGTTHSIGPNPADAGKYRVLITDGNGCTALTNVVNVTDKCIIIPPCNPTGNSIKFNYAVNQIGHCTDVQFFALPSGNPPLSISWQFSNLGGASGTSPNFTFPASGIYSVTVTGHYGPGKCDESYTLDVLVPVQSDFYMSVNCDSNVMAVDLINTTNVVHGPLDGTWNYSWTVYNSSLSVVDASVNKDFMNVGGLTPGDTFLVKLIVSKTYTWNGQTINASCEIQSYITVPIPATAYYTFAPTPPVCQNIPLTFTDSSSGDIVSWFWDFGDGSSILTQDPEKTYANNGSYTVQLTVTDEYGCYDTYNAPAIQVELNQLAGNFVIDSMPMCPGDTATVIFNNTSPGSSAPFSYLWSTGDTTTSIEVLQTSNNYMYVTDNFNCTKEFGPAIVSVVEIPDPFITGDKTYCDGDEIKLICNYGEQYTYTWFEGSTNVGAGIEYSATLAPGTYSFTVEISASGCSKVSAPFVIDIYNLPPVPVVTTNPVPACPNVPVQLNVTNPSNYSFITWSEGTVGPSTTVMSSGMYYAVGTDTNGCENAGSAQVFELPDFCGFMCGCYDTCIVQGDTFFFPGIVGIYNYWEWQQLSFGSWNAVSSGTGMITPFQTTVAGNYNLRLYVETLDGCTGESCEADIDLIYCGEPLPDDSCDGDIYMETIECTINAQGQVEYNFFMGLNYLPGGAPCSGYNYTIIPPSGNIINLTQSQLNSGWNGLGGTWQTGTSFYPGQVVCFDVVVTNPCDQTECFFEICFDVPECGEEEEEIDPCEGSAHFTDVHCNTDKFNNVVYTFNLNFTYYPNGTPCSNYTYSLVPPTGNIMVFNSPNITGPNTYNIGGTWITNQPYYAQQTICFDLIITNTCDGTKCKFHVCTVFPECGDPAAGGRLKGERANQGSQSDMNDRIHFYPNPTKHSLNVSIPEKGEYEFRMYNVQGEIVMQQVLQTSSANVLQLDVSRLNTGVYTIMCVGQTGIRKELIFIE